MELKNIKIPHQLLTAAARALTSPEKTNKLLIAKFPTDGRNYSSPAVDKDGNVYFGSMDGNFYALNSSGQLRWRKDFYDKEGSPAGIHSKPVIDKRGCVHFACSNGYLCQYYTANSGELMWSVRLSDCLFGQSPHLAENGTIYQGAGKDGLYAVDPVNRMIKWNYKIGKDEVLNVASDNKQVYFGTGNGYIYALDHNGNFKWSYKIEGKGNKTIRQAPFVSSDGTVYAASCNGNLYALTPDGELKWRKALGNLLDTNISEGKDGVLYFGSSDKNLYAIQPDGKTKWKFKTEDVVTSAPAIAENGTLYFGSLDKNLYALTPDGKLKFKYNLGENAGSSPVLGRDGKIYIATEGSGPFAGEGFLFILKDRNIKQAVSETYNSRDNLTIEKGEDSVKIGSASVPINQQWRLSRR